MAQSGIAQPKAVQEEEQSTIWSVITASSVGTLIEWYDFYIFGSLATVIATQFFPKENPTAALLSTLGTFAAGFVVRPFGALFFGRLGDLVGRKYTFLLTLILMGGSTFLIGCVPGYETIGFAAPIIVLLLRLLQGLALGGEYGGAATYVAEHAPVGERGYWTSYIQTTATLGLFVSLGVILLVRQSMDVASFNSWGWRIPFILSVFLVGISIYIRLKMSESPMFSKVKKEGKLSVNPLVESFGKKENLKMVLLALLGATAGQGVVWYTGQFYALFFITTTCAVETVQANILVGIALLIATPFFIVFGAWSDKIGRKAIMMAGMLIAVLTYRPIYQTMYDTADVKQKGTPTKVDAKPSVAVLKVDSLHKAADSVVTTTSMKEFADGTVCKETKTEIFPADSAKKKELFAYRAEGEKRAAALAALPDSLKADAVAADAATLAGIFDKPKAKVAVKNSDIKLASGGFWLLIALVTVQVIYVTMVYGPIAAFLVELFPTRIRYTSMSLPYHIGNGVFGGLVPLIGTRLVGASQAAGNPTFYLDGLWYPMIVASVCFIIGTLYITNKIDADVTD